MALFFNGHTNVAKKKFSTCSSFALQPMSGKACPQSSNGPPRGFSPSANAAQLGGRG